MKILIFDDSKIHRIAAQLTLGGEHEITVVDTYDKAAAALSTEIDYERLTTLRAEANIGRYPNEGTADMQAAWNKANEELQEKARRRPDFDVVLTDLLVLPSSEAQGPEGEKFLGQEMPLGTIIALRALAAGIKMVAVVTDMNHHNHPASAAFDGFKPFSIGTDVKVICTNNAGDVPIDVATGELVSGEFLDSDQGREKYPFPDGQRWGERKSLGSGKNWRSVLNRLTGKVTLEE